MPSALVILALLVFSLALGSTKADDYDESLARRMVVYQSAAYCKDGVASWGKSGDCAPCQALSNTSFITSFSGLDDTFGFLAVDPTRSTITLSFRGSVDIPNWIADLDAVQMPFPDLPSSHRIHEGFYKTTASLIPEIAPALTDAIKANPGFALHVTGHSLGAALATTFVISVLAEAEQMKKERRRASQVTDIVAALNLNLNPKVPSDSDAVPIVLYTAGCPRVMNPSLRDWFSRTVAATTTLSNHRLVHWRDIVTSLPYKWLGYAHAGVEVFYPEDMDSGKYTVCTEGESKDCADGLKLRFSAKDHQHYFGFSVPGSC